MAIGVLIIGVPLARLMKHHVRKRLQANTQMDASSVLAVQRFTHIFTLVVAVYIAIAVLRIPLTVFHFAVGGLMIGVGFGAKELFGNLIGGVILMAERPVKVGDVVEVKGQIGRIFDIGIRSVQIHTEENMDVMLPNSVVLGETLVNWTKNDRVILTEVTIGIAYESDIDAATAVMIEAAGTIEGVLDQPPPFVLFKEHGGSTLNFQVFISVRVLNKMECWQYQSKLNYALNRALRAAGIEIAFPQLDVHVLRPALAESSATPAGGPGPAADDSRTNP